MRTKRQKLVFDEKCVECGKQLCLEKDDWVEQNNGRARNTYICYKCDTDLFFRRLIDFPITAVCIESSPYATGSLYITGGAVTASTAREWRIQN